MKDIIWVTGAKGFIGQQLAKQATAQGKGVIGFGRAEKSDVDPTEMEAMYPLNANGLLAAATKFGTPSRVFHLAGGPTVGQSFQRPQDDFDSNVVTTQIVLEAIRKLNSDVSLVLASSAAVYGNNHRGQIKTTDKLAPTSPYGFHKLIAEQLVQSHADAFGLRATVCRVFSVYGPGLRKQLLFDACHKLASLADNQPLELSGSGNERRDWLNVNDAVTGLLQTSIPCAGKVNYRNLATSQGTTIHEISSLLATIWQDGTTVSFSGEVRPGDPESLVAAPESLPIGFAPKTSLEDGLAELVAWFRTTIDASR